MAESLAFFDRPREPRVGFELTTGSALPSVVSPVSQMRDPGRGNGRIGVRFDSLREGTGFEFRLTGFGSANFRSLSRWRASNAYQDVVIREPDRTGPSGTWPDPRSDAEARKVAFRVAQPGCGARREHTGEHLRCIGGKGKRRGPRVLFEAADVARAGDRHDKRLLRQQPGKR